MSNNNISVAKWLGIMVLLMIPLVNLIMLFVWAFGRDSRPVLKNYARANLILLGIGIIIVAALLASGVALLPQSA
jgi:hypothetical protein